MRVLTMALRVLRRPIGANVPSITCRFAALPPSRTFVTFLSPSRPQIRMSGPSLSYSPSVGAINCTSSILSSPDINLDLASHPSSNPFLAGQQLRHGPRPTMNRWSHLVRKRRFGFLARKRSKTGRRILARRQAKGRRFLTH